MNEKNDIVKANALIEACYKPASLNQMRLLLAALMQVKATDKLSYKTEFVVTAGSLAELTGTAKRQNYRELKRAADELFEMYVTVYDKPNNEGKVHKRYTKKRVVSQCVYCENEGSVRLMFAPPIIPYISALSSYFTKYKARYVMPMRSSYGIRLYELFLQWLGFGPEREFEVDEFKELLGLEGKYKIVTFLKRDVIKPALTDINKYSDLKVEFGQRKTGRRVTHFQFVITKKETPKRKPKQMQQTETEQERRKRWDMDLGLLPGSNSSDTPPSE